MKKTITLGKDRFSIDYLKSISEDTALKVFAQVDSDRVINAHKRANGKSVRNQDKKTESK